MYVYYLSTPYLSKTTYLNCSYCMQMITWKDKKGRKMLCRKNPFLNTVTNNMYLNCDKENLMMIQVTHQTAPGGKCFWNLIYSLSGVHAILYKWKRNNWNTGKITFRETIKLKMTNNVGASKEQNEQSIKALLVPQLEISPYKFREEKKTNEENTMSKSCKKTEARKKYPRDNM